MKIQIDKSNFLISFICDQNVCGAADMLVGHGYRVMVYGKDVESLEFVSDYSPSLMLIDAQTTESGFEMLQKIKRQVRLVGIPFGVIMRDCDVREEFFKQGAFDVICKPFSKTELLTKIASRYESSAIKREYGRLSAQISLKKSVGVNGVLHADCDSCYLNEMKERLFIKSFALDRVHEAAYLIDSAGRFYYVNDEASRSLGYTRQELLGMTVLDIETNLTPLVWKAIFGRIRALRAEVRESYHLSQKGVRLMVEIASSYFEYEGSEYILALVRDIAERKRAEEALALRERDFRSLAENMPDHLIRYDLSGRIIYIKPETARMFGFESEQLQGVHLREKIFKMRNSPVTDEFEKRLRIASVSGQRSEIVIRVEHAIDGWQLHNIRFVPERNVDGVIVSVLTIGRDVTAQKKSELALIEREQRYREVFNGISDNLYTIEVRGTDDFIYLDVNPAFERWYGVSRDGLIGKLISDCLPNDEWEKDC